MPVLFRIPLLGLPKNLQRNTYLNQNITEAEGYCNATALLTSFIRRNKEKLILIF